jgi:hypothetical protein
VNRVDILVRLGAPQWLADRGRFSVGPDGTPVEDDLGEQQEAAARLTTILDGLRDIARPVPPPPGRRGRGKPRTPRSFHDFVDRVAAAWERASGTPFRQTNHPATFAHEVTKFVDPARSEESTTYVIKLIVAERRA